MEHGANPMMTSGALRRSALHLHGIQMLGTVQWWRWWIQALISAIRTSSITYGPTRTVRMAGTSLAAATGTPRKATTQPTGSAMVRTFQEQLPRQGTMALGSLAWRGTPK